MTGTNYDVTREKRLMSFLALRLDFRKLIKTKPAMTIMKPKMIIGIRNLSSCLPFLLKKSTIIKISFSAKSSLFSSIL